MANEESALQVARQAADIPGSDWQPNFREANAISNQATSRVVIPDSPTANEAEPETSVTQLSAVLLIILGGMAITFALGAIIVFLAAHG
jgi:hypothetical protein